jgi:dihydropteroate synthase
MDDWDHDQMTAERVLQVGAASLPLGERTYVMAVLNVSPDSKNVHTVAHSVDDALLMADRYRSWGAALIDVGGQSSHLDNETIAASDEISRVVPVIEALVAEDHLVAIDTWKPEVARAAIDAGAVIVNDTGGLRDPGMRQVVSGSDVAAIAVYVEGANPHEVAEITISSNKAADMASRFSQLLDELASEGISNVILDPGIAINYQGNYQEYTNLQIEVIADSGKLHELGRPVLIPIPRKRDFHRVAAYVALALEHRADMIRVHDVAMACDLARLFRRLD